MIVGKLAQVKLTAFPSYQECLTFLNGGPTKSFGLAFCRRESWSVWGARSDSTSSGFESGWIQVGKGTQA